MSASAPADRSTAAWLARLDRQDPVEFDRTSLAEAALEAALRITGAPRGNVQFTGADRVLRIEAQRGFEQPFLDFFRIVRPGQAACGAAEQSGNLVIIEDVCGSPLFAHSPALHVMLAAEARAVSSLPIMDRWGEVAGVLSVHYPTRDQPSTHEIAVLQSVVLRVGLLL